MLSPEYFSSTVLLVLRTFALQSPLKPRSGLAVHFRHFGY